MRSDYEKQQRIIETDKFILMPSLIGEIKLFLINHLGNTLIMIIKIE